MARSTIGPVLSSVAFALLAACSTPAGWHQVDESHLYITIRGRLDVLELSGHGDVRLEVTPDTRGAYSLASGQKRLVCIVHSRDRKDMDAVLLNLAVGQTVRVSGYWTTMDEHYDRRHYLNDTLSIQIVE